MATPRQIVAILNELNPSLTKTDLVPFGRKARLEFRSGSELLVLELTGIHFVGTRQSLIGTDTLRVGPECIVDFFEIYDRSDFLEKFLTDNLGYVGDVFVYDTKGRSKDDSGFIQPLHVNVNCTAGILDVVCEHVELKRGGQVFDM